MKMKRIMLFMILLTGATVVNAQSRKQNNWFVDTSVGSVADMFTVNVGIHKQKTDRFSLGFTSGAMVSDGQFVLPLLADARYEYPFERSKFSLLGTARGGFYLNTSEVDESMIGMELMPGVQYRIDSRVAIRLQIGVSLGIDFNGHFEGAIPLLFGLSYRL